jgi:hypothetical protein
MATDWASKTVAELDEEGAKWEGYPASGNKAEKVAFLETTEGVVEEPEEEAEEEAEPEEEVEVPAQTGPQPSELGEPEVPEGMEVIDPDTVGEGGLGADPVIYAGTWVRLRESGEVPEECWGHIGVITFAPVLYVQEGELSPRPYEEQGEGKFIVHTRDEHGYDLQLTKDDFSAMSSAGRHEIMSHG